MISNHLHLKSCPAFLLPRYFRASHWQTILMVMAPFDQSSHSFRSEHQPEQSSEPDAELEMRGNKGRDESGNSHQERYVVDGLKYDGEPALPAETTLEHILSSLLSTPTFPTIVQPAITSSVSSCSIARYQQTLINTR